MCHFGGVRLWEWLLTRTLGTIPANLEKLAGRLQNLHLYRTQLSGTVSPPCGQLAACSLRRAACGVQHTTSGPDSATLDTHTQHEMGRRGSQWSSGLALQAVASSPFNIAHQGPFVALFPIFSPASHSYLMVLCVCVCVVHVLWRGRNHPARPPGLVRAPQLGSGEQHSNIRYAPIICCLG